MQSTGGSEFENSEAGKPKLSVGFWQVFLLTLAGSSGLISMVADGPLWLTCVGLVASIFVLFWIIASQRKSRN